MRRFIAVFAAFALLSMLAVPAMAAKPNLNFTTHLTEDGVTLAGSSSSGFTVITHGNATALQHTLGVTGTKANPGLVIATDGSVYPFFLVATPAQKATLSQYFIDKNWGVPAYYDQINAEIAGTAPFFYFNAGTEQDYHLLDGFMSVVGTDYTMYPLKIDDDYPVGTYTYSGTLIGTNGATRVFTIKMTVVRV